MANIEIVDTIPTHLVELSQHMRREDELTSIHLGLVPRKALRNACRASIIKKTALVDGKVGAVWGLVGALLGGVGNPWLLTSCVANCVSPFVFVRIFKQELDKMLEIFPILEDWADEKHIKSLRLLELLGFSFDDPVVRGPNGEKFIKAELRA